MKFKDMPYKRIDFKQVEAEIQSLMRIVKLPG